MTEERQNILIYKLLGYQPVKSWRFFYDREKSRGPFGFRTKKDALEAIERDRNSWPYSQYPQEYEFSEPEEYDDWFHCPNVDLNLMHKIEENLLVQHKREYYKRLRMSPVEFSEHSPVEDRREALLKTLSIWSD